MASNSTASIPALASSLPSWLFPSQLTPVEYSCKGLPLPNVFDGTMEVIQTPEFWLRCGISGVVATFLYVVWGFMVASRFPRTVEPLTRNGKVVERPFGTDLSSDLVLALVSLGFGTPVIAGIAVAHEKWCITSTYLDIFAHPWGATLGITGPWALAYWVVSIPAYLLIWDAWFYVFHLILHTEPVYSVSHANHHAFKPPVAWSGIAIDPIENFFSGLGPYLFPLLVPLPFLGYLPFHLYTVYALNVGLMGWALFLHSSSTWAGNWWLMGPIYHNRHHATGRLRNGNYGAIFKVYDRLFGTLLEDGSGSPERAEWQVEEMAAAAAAAAAAAVAVAGGKGGNAQGEPSAPPADASAKKGGRASTRRKAE